MADRFYKDIELPDLPASITPPAPETGFIQVYGKEGKLAYSNSQGQETIVETGGGETVVAQLNINGGAAGTSFQQYLLRFDFGASGANINPTGTV